MATGVAVPMVGKYQSESKIMPTTTENLFNDAISTIHQRGAVYGHPYYNHKRIADLWSAYLDWPIQPHEVAICMALVKVSRLTETPSHEDSVKDLIAYAALYKTILDVEMDEDICKEDSAEWLRNNTGKEINEDGV
jgi:hypothetical protein